MTDEARDAQEELKGYRAACHALTKQESDMANLRARFASTSRSALDMGIQDNHDLKATDGLLAAMVDRMRLYISMRDETELFCRQMKSRIDRISGVPGQILRMKYIQNQTLEKIAIPLGYSYRQILRLHIDGLEAYARLVHSSAFSGNKNDVAADQVSASLVPNGEKIVSQCTQTLFTN